jgi:NADH-quinone oxidoreductase subunit H
MRNRINGGYHGILLYENGFYFAEYANMFISLPFLLFYSSSVAITTGDWAVENWGVNLATYRYRRFIYKNMLHFPLHVGEMDIPRFRYDQLMHLGWRVLIPLSIVNIIIITGIVILRANST